MDLNKFKTLTKEQYLAMPKEQREAIKQSLAQHQQNSQVLVDQATQETLTTEIPNQIKNSNIKASLVAAAQGLSMGTADNITSGMLATKHAIESTRDAIAKQGMAGFDNFLPTWKSTYDKAQAGFNEAIQDLKKKHPEEFDDAYFGGSLVSGVALGTSSIAKMASKSLVGQLGLMSAEGFMHGVGMSQAETLGGDIAAGAQGALETGIAGGTILGGIKGIGKAASALQNRALFPEKIIKYFSGDMKTFIQETDLYEKEDVAKFVKRIVNYTDSNGKFLLEPTQNAYAAKKAVERSLVDTGRDLGKVISTIDESGVVPKSNIDSLISSINRDIVEEIAGPSTRVGSRTSSKLQESMRKRLDDEFFMDDPSGAMIKLADKSEIPKRIPREWDLASLVKYKNDLSREIPAKLKEGGLAEQKANVLKKIRNKIHYFIRDEVEAVSHKFSDDTSKDLYSLYTESSKKYSDLLSLDNLLEKKVKNPNSLDAYTKFFKESWGKVTLGTAAATSMFGVAPTAAGLTIGALALVAANPRVNKAVSMSLNRVVDAAKNNPDKYSKYLTRIAVSSEVSSKGFFDAVTRLGAEVDLGEQPLNRTTEDLINRQDSLLAIANDIDPELHSMLNKAFTTGNPDVLATMILNTPELVKHVSPGIGWDGKAVTKQDKQAVMQYLQKLKPRARKYGIEQFSATGMIPEGMLLGKGKEPEKQLIFKKAKDKIRKPRF